MVEDSEGNDMQTNEIAEREDCMMEVDDEGSKGQRDISVEESEEAMMMDEVRPESEGSGYRRSN